jgi:hypothetical protein
MSDKHVLSASGEERQLGALVLKRELVDEPPFRASRR